MNIDDQLSQILGDVIDCPYCVDGFIPAPVDRVLGFYYRDCLRCVVPCVDCAGKALFIVTCCMNHFAKRLNTEFGLIPILCFGCGGLYGTQEIPR